jgi:uncharacterized membrane protein
MLPDPLHPALVHLPLALAVLLPLLALAAALAIRSRRIPAQTWLAIVVLQALLVGSGWLAAESGEQQEERVEEVVAESPIETHEEQAEGFLLLGAVTLLAAGAGLLPAAAGGVARGVAVAAMLVVLLSAVRVGHSGGELVYTHGAANAYLSEGARSSGVPGRTWAGLRRDHDDDDDDD